MPKSKATVNLDQPIYGVAEVAAYCGIRKPNVRSMLERYNIQPYAEISVGPVWKRRDVERMQERRMRDEKARAADELRRQSARS